MVNTQLSYVICGVGIGYTKDKRGESLFHLIHIQLDHTSKLVNTS